MKKTFLFVCIVFLFSFCKKETGISEVQTLKDQPPIEFRLNEIEIRNHSVIVKWEPSYDPENCQIVYDVYLNNILKIKDIDGLSCEIPDLLSSTYYIIEIAARDVKSNVTRTKTSFTTLEVDNSILVHSFFLYQGKRRDFAYYIPSGCTTTTSTPMVINLHGANGNAWNEINYSSYRSIAERENFILLMPQALLGTYNGETIFQWNAHYLFPWDDVKFLDHLIDYMFTRFTVDLSKVYISGMSNGGFMTFFAARGLQDRVAAIAPIAGLISANVFSDFSLNRPIPLCYMHGTADSIVLIDSSPSAEDVIKYWAINNKCSISPQIFHMPDLVIEDHSQVTLYQYTGYMANSEIQYYIIEGGGHSIPGVEPGANMDINAYEVIWSFFERHINYAHSPGKIVKL